MYNDNDFEIIINEILKEVTPYQILLFGSYAKQNQNEDSDIDLMILVKEEINRKTKMDTLFRLEKRFLKLKYDIDLLLKNYDDYNKYKKYIGTINYEVAKENRVLWTKN